MTDDPTAERTDDATARHEQTENRSGENDRTEARDEGDPTAKREGDPNETSDHADESGRLRGLLDRAALGAWVFLALVTAIGFYRYSGATIRTWVDPAYQPIVLAAFNLALLFVAAVGVSVQLRRIGEE